MAIISETKVFDPRDGSTGSGGAELLDATVVLRGGQWWMYLAGQASGYGPTDIYSASLSPGAPLSASGWEITRNTTREVAPVAARTVSADWDGNGGRHCPSYVKGWDPEKGEWVERIYYAGAAANLWGPYAIGFLEWDGTQWVDQPQSVFAANEDWEHGSVYEPNLIYHDGKWKMWYVAGSNQDDYLVHGYAESADGRTGWSQHVIFAPPEIRRCSISACAPANKHSKPYSRESGSQQAHHPRRLGCGGAGQPTRPATFPIGGNRFRS